LLARGEENSIRTLQAKDALSGLMRQIYLPPDPIGALATMELIDRLTKDVPIYALHCNMTEDAVKTSFEAMTGSSYSHAKGKYQ
jgi:hypothetical protein